MEAMMDREPLASLALVTLALEAARLTLAGAALPQSETLSDLQEALSIAHINALYLSSEIEAGMQTPADRKAVRV
jgi:hypothetical protein